MENNLVSHLNTRCVGCGANIVVEFLVPKIVVSAPELCCSTECLEKYNQSIEAWREMRRVG